MDMGGMYWVINMIGNQVFCFISVYLYQKYSDDENNNFSVLDGDGFHLSPSISPSSAPSPTPSFTSPNIEAPVVSPLLQIIFGLFAFSMISFAGFLKLINRKSLVTFFDTRTGKEFLCDNWRNGAGRGDRERFHIFSKHKSYYKSINNELKEWLHENWEKWNYEREDWFTAKMIGKIPAEILPERVLVSLGGVKGRRKSIDKLVMEEQKEEEKGEKKAQKATLGQIVPLHPGLNL